MARITLVDNIVAWLAGAGAASAASGKVIIPKLPKLPKFDPVEAIFGSGFDPLGVGKLGGAIGDIAGAGAQAVTGLLPLVLPQESVTEAFKYWTRVPIIQFAVAMGIGVGGALAVVKSPTIQAGLLDILAPKKNGKRTVVLT